MAALYRNPALAIAGLLIFFHGLGATAQPRWTAPKGVGGGIIYAIERDSSNRLLAASRHAVFASGDNGGHWEQIIHSPLNADFTITPTSRSLAVTTRGTILIAAGARFVRLAGGGTAETIDPFTLPAEYEGVVPCIVAAADGSVYATFSSDDPSKGRLYRSTDDGLTWQSIAAGDAGINSPNSLTITATNAMIMGCNIGLYRSVDGGAHWTRTASTRNINLTHRTALGTILAMDGFGKTYRSVDDGISWDTVTIAAKNLVASELVNDASGRIILATRSGPYASVDDGVHWAPLSNHLIVGGMVIGANGSMFAATFDGVWDMGATGTGWTRASNELAAVEVTAFCSGPDKRAYAGTEASGLFMSIDDGRQWSRTAMKGRILSVLETSRGTILVHVGDSAFDGCSIWRSTDRGSTWSMSRDVGRYKTYTTLAQTASDRIYLGSAFGIYMSADDGLTWSMFKTTPGTVVSMLADSTGLLLAAAGSVLLRSVDSGATWESLNQTVPIRDLIRDTRGAIYCARDTGVPLRSTDNGATWTPLGGAGLPGSPLVWTVALARDGSLFAAVRPRGLVMYDSVSASWLPATDGIEGETVLKISSTPGGTLLAGTLDAGIFLSASPAGAAGPYAPVTRGRAVVITPNPASTHALITLPDGLKAHGEIDLLTSTGELAAHFADFEHQPAPGVLSIDINGIPSGIYYCRVHDAAGTIVTPLVIVR